MCAVGYSLHALNMFLAKVKSGSPRTRADQVMFVDEFLDLSNDLQGARDSPSSSLQRRSSLSHSLPLLPAKGL